MEWSDPNPPALPPADRPRPVPAKSSFLLADTILQDIIRDDLKPGDALPPERAMAEKYGMGRGTVREALRLLEYQGAVQIRPGLNGGPFVRNPDSSHLAGTIVFLMQMQRTPFKSIVEVRTAIEPMICRLAAERITEEALSELERTISEMRKLVGSRTGANEFNELNTRFHNVVAWSSGNPLFRYFADSLLDIMDGAVVGLSYSERNHRGVIAAHRAIYTALREGDPDSAGAAMTKHLAEWADYARKRFPEALNEVIPGIRGGSRGSRPGG